MSLARQLLGVPTASNALETFALSDTDAVNHLVLPEDLLNRDLLLEVLTSPINLLRNSAAVNLNFHDVGLLVAVLQDLDLSVSNDADSRAVLLDLVQILIDRLLAIFIAPFLGVLGEALLLALIPVIGDFINSHVI